MANGKTLMSAWLAGTLPQKQMSEAFINSVFLAMSGLVTMWAGVFADVGIMMLCVLNSIRILGRGALKNVIKADVEEEHTCCCDHC